MKMSRIHADISAPMDTPAQPAPLPACLDSPHWHCWRMELHKAIKGQPEQQPAGDHLKHEPTLHDAPHAQTGQAQRKKRSEIHGVASEPRHTLVQVIERPE